MRDLWEYTSTRKSLLSKKIYLLASACEGNLAEADKKAATKARGTYAETGLKRTTGLEFARNCFVQTNV